MYARELRHTSHSLSYKTTSNVMLVLCPYVVHGNFLGIESENKFTVRIICVQ